MTGLQIAVVVFCGLVIALALFLLVRSLRKMAKGRCCEGCDGCSQAGNCSSIQTGCQGEEKRDERK